MKPAPQLVIPLDLDDLAAAAAVVQTLGPDVRWYKVGKQLFTRHGPAAVRLLKDAGKLVFLDLKFHDIPNTVAQAVRSAVALGADLINVHASGGPRMMEAAAAARGDRLVIAVTVLTSLDASDLAAVGVMDPPAVQVVRLARLAQASGLQGVVASAQELPELRRACGPDFLFVIPGIRPANAPADDQKRVMTAGEAVRAGADFLVVGRPILRAADPRAAAEAVLAEIAAARSPA